MQLLSFGTNISCQIFHPSHNISQLSELPTSPFKYRFLLSTLFFTCTRRRNEHVPLHAHSGADRHSGISSVPGQHTIYVVLTAARGVRQHFLCGIDMLHFCCGSFSLFVRHLVGVVLACSMPPCTLNGRLACIPIRKSQNIIQHHASWGSTSRPELKALDAGGRRWGRGWTRSR